MVGATNTSSLLRKTATGFTVLLAVVILLPIFVLSLFTTWRLLETKRNGRQ